MNSAERSRRQFLRTLGVGAASLPFISLLEAVAAEPNTAQRFIGVLYPHGASSPLFRMRAGETETQFDLRSNDCVLSPFDEPETYGRSFKDKLLIIEGLDLATAIEAGKSGHGGTPSLLTGTGIPNGPSLEQYLAVTRKLGAATRVTSLVLGVGHQGPDEQCISYGVNGVPIAKTIDPRKVFDVVFKDLMVSSDAAAAAAAERDRRRGKSVIDFVRGDLNRLRGRLAAPEQLKLDQHLTAMRDIEKRIDLLSSAACTIPTMPKAFPKLAGYDGGEPYFEEITNLQVDLLAQAMACGQTRFATLWLNDLSRGATANTGISGMPDDCHQDLAHRYLGPTDQPGDPNTWSALGRHMRYSYSKCARLLQRLANFGILDDTLVMISSEMGDPNQHSSRNIPVVLAGGAAGQFRMGRRLVLASDCPANRYYCDPPALTPHNRLLVSIARAFGLTDVDSFGTARDAATVRGELAGLR